MVDEKNENPASDQRGRQWKQRPPHEDFDNRQYWEQRYTTEPERGSGAGSRGEYLEFKQALLRRVIDEVRPQSILDVGCGDIAVVRGLTFAGTYTGIDVSPSIVERNRILRPDWKFIEGDFLELARSGGVAADLVICFDVLIHQHDPDTYRKFARELVGLARKVALVNGFERSFKRGKQQPICAFHEPLSSTLALLGQGKTSAVGKFRGTRIFRVDTAELGAE